MSATTVTPVSVLPSGLLDSFGRTATDLRVSLTERCNLRCTYCMPADGLPLPPADEVLTGAEVVRLVRVAVERLGVRQVRFTGGEPLLRRDLVDIVAGCAALQPRPEISLTTNAVGLSSRASALARAGLDRINVSLDSLHAATYQQIARRPFLRQTLDGIAAASSAGLGPIKVNAVLLRGVNEQHAVELLAWCLERGHQLRVIEQMPLDADRVWDRTTMVTAAETRALLSTRFDLTPDAAPRDGAPAELYLVRERGEARVLGRVGIIASVTESFCGDCRRTRLTADGAVRSCLFSAEETSLRLPLRAGTDDAELARLWRAAMWAKPAGHGLDRGLVPAPSRSMSAIGG